MTEAEWLSLTRTTSALMNIVSERASNRKRRLYAVACCYRIWSSFNSDFLREGVRTAERLADCQATDDELVELRRLVDEAAGTYLGQWQLCAANAVKFALATADRVDGFKSGEHAAVALAYSVMNGEYSRNKLERINREENQEQIRLVLRDIFGNPFRPVSFNPAWRTDTAVTLARGMYDSRDFGAMPILADALQDAGCEDDAILNHCRDAGGGLVEPARGSTIQTAHVRGCWVCDLVLGLT